MKKVGISTPEPEPRPQPIIQVSPYSSGPDYHSVNQAAENFILFLSLAFGLSVSILALGLFMSAINFVKGKK